MVKAVLASDELRFEEIAFRVAHRFQVEHVSVAVWDDVKVMQRALAPVVQKMVTEGGLVMIPSTPKRPWATYRLPA